MSEWSKEPDSSSGGQLSAQVRTLLHADSLHFINKAAMSERSKEEVLRTSVLNHSWVRTPLAAHRFHSVEVSTWDFDSHIPGSTPGGTYFFIIPSFNV